MLLLHEELARARIRDRLDEADTRRQSRLAQVVRGRRKQAKAAAESPTVAQAHLQLVRTSR